MIRLARGTILVAALSALGSCGALKPDDDRLPAGGIHVLFVGNSLTYTNDLPSVVAAIAATAGDTVRVRAETAPGLALIDHINGGTSAVNAIRSGGWDFVVLQQGPSSLAINRDSLVLWTGMFDAEVKRVHARTALYMVWPATANAASFDAVRASYQQAAQSVGGVFLPAGEAWRSAWAEDSTLALYGADGFHPSTLGTYLAALTIYERLSGRDARSLPPLAPAIDSSVVRLLQRAAHDANTRFASVY